MADPIIVSENAGTKDAIQSAVRSVVFIVASVTAILGLVKAHDAAGAALYVQNNLGEFVAAVSALVALGTAGYGVLKAHTRGAQIASVASNPKVPASIATTE